MKITVIGGGERVGSCAAFALQCAGLVAEIQILDANKDMAEGTDGAAGVRARTERDAGEGERLKVPK